MNIYINFEGCSQSKDEPTLMSEPDCKENKYLMNGAIKQRITESLFPRKKAHSLFIHMEPNQNPSERQQRL